MRAQGESIDSHRRSRTRRPNGVTAAVAFVGFAVIAALFPGANPQAQTGGTAPAPVPGVAGGVGKIASVQNQVETMRKSSGGWSPSTVYQVLYALDRVRTGPGSRAAILYSDRTLHRVGEKSEIEIQPPSGGQPGLLKVVSGTHYFSSRSPKDYGRIETPTVTAAIKGTEFVVEVAEDKTTTITMLEGTVEASNAMGSVTVGSGEQAQAEPGKAPTKKIVVRPRDAVAWAIDYPPILGASDAKRLEGLGQTGTDLTRAATMLSEGQVEPARGLIESARGSSPNEPVGLALASVIAVSQNNDDEAMKLAEQAWKADPNSSAAALAVSYAAQARHDIPRARAMAEKAAELDPTGSVALARAAGLRMAEGDLKGARAAAQEAVKRAPGNARALAVEGFVELASYRTRDALALFEKAAAADPSSSLARLGLGIARIRTGEVQQGREELQTATALDPDDSLLRSYLGKALYEEKLGKDASKELAEAKRLDPNDPTPWLYDAILKQNENRPVEALRDLHESIVRNDNRAVYRSRMLLDEDRAVRASDLARIYNDLGFEELGLVTARRSADEDQSNFSSHLFLAGNYRTLPGYAPAFFSELLQARIYQPVSVNAARPDVVNESSSFNEYTALFDRPRLRVFAGITGGGTNTGLSGIYPSNPFFTSVLDTQHSGFQGKDLTGTYNTDRLSMAVGYAGFEDDGFRTNNDREIDNYRVFAEYALGSSDFFQINFQRGLQDTGDLPLRFLPAVFAFERFETRLWNAAAGYHHIFSPGSDLAVSFVYNATEQAAHGFTCDPAALPDCDIVLSPGEGRGSLRGPQLEVQQVLRGSWLTWVFGAGGFRGTSTLGATGVVPIESDDEYTNGYLYLTMRPLPALDITVGGSGEKVVAPTGLFSPRDSGIGVADLTFEDSQFSPKVGVTFRPWTDTTLRGAFYERMNPAIGRIQSLEPTQVAGFNQFYREPGGTQTTGYGAGIDHAFGTHVFVGASYLHRDLDIPEAACDNPSPFAWCSGQPATHIEMKESTNGDSTLYVDAVLSNILTVTAEGSYLTREFDEIQVNSDSLFEDESKTWRAGPGMRLFLPCGFFAGAAATYYNQVLHEFDDFTSDTRIETKIRFWTGDLSLGYKLPHRYGTIQLDARNVSDREFEQFDRELEETVIPARTVTLRFNLTY